eukprot:12138931-Alexandrium_andersonii.AAC.1
MKPRACIAFSTCRRKIGTLVGSVPIGMPTNSQVRSCVPGGGSKRGRRACAGGPRPLWKLYTNVSSAPSSFE